MATVRRYAAALLGAGLCLLLAAQPGAAAQEPGSAPQDVRIAVRAHSGAAHALKRWGPTADHLTAKLPGYRFVMVPFENIAVLNEAVSRGEFEFVLTNPASYVEYELRHGVRHLATLINNRDGQGYTEFGTVIFTRADRTDINTLEDLRGKTFMGVSEQGFGGWRAAWHEMRRQGIDPYKDFSHVMFAGGIQPRVVEAVANRLADAGSVRTDMLERMTAAGQIDLADFKILNRRSTPGFPFAHSTPLYPEWPFARSAHTDDRLAEQVARVLLSVSADDRAARAGQYLGWHTPLDYSPVHEVLRELGVGPYMGSGSITVEHLLQEYGPWFAVALVGLIVLAALLVRLKLLNDRLRTTEAQLKDMAMHDGLTGLANRHRLEEFLQQAWRQATRNRTEISAVLFDIDFFKEYNDRYGHVAGDDCLRRIAGCAARLFRRATDLVARYGGEEFLVILVDTGADESWRQSEELRNQISEMAMPHSASRIADRVTISIGIATCVPFQGSKPEQLIAAADAALYQAKSAGRNRVVRADCASCAQGDAAGANHTDTSA